MIGEPGTATSEAQAIADRVLACAGVAGLSGGRFGTVATYLPGERLLGVSVSGAAIEIAIVATLDRPLPETAAEVRRTVLGLAGDRRVDVRIDDIRIEDAPAGQARSGDDRLDKSDES
ncbi:Asp23/Gls24 family envelope stress response protein [Nonomuraea zeae]|uniref:Asp23/Gls24 family envelope stress response protein n=1 Tax=Nonomuraea zeae TaxID=1642303 RepID=UPI00197FECA3|nr:Asp23/Gls24 family envelope stress response protein [Nonomuraea zeae]